MRRVAERVGLQLSELKRIECNRKPPDEAVLRRLADDLGENIDVLLAGVGEIATDIRATIIQRPVLFAELIRGLDGMPDKKLTVLVRQVYNCKREDGFNFSEMTDQ
jgi:transcriptional regulator with XRE-family HTH domain